MSEWTLFLDRDGVLNKRIVGSYVRQWSEFEFLEGVLEAMPILARKFKYIFVVTNQQGIAKGIMTTEDLELVHEQMKRVVEAHNGRFDRIYYCPEHERTNPICRKPNTGMAEQAQQDFPDIDFTKSIMVGDSVTDIEFGKRMGMQTIFITTKHDIDPAKLEAIQSQIDYSFPSVAEFTKEVDAIIA